MEHHLLDHFNAGMKFQAWLGKHCTARLPQFVLATDGIEKHGCIDENRQPLAAG